MTAGPLRPSQRGPSAVMPPAALVPPGNFTFWVPAAAQKNDRFPKSMGSGYFYSFACPESVSFFLFENFNDITNNRGLFVIQFRNI